MYKNELNRAVKNRAARSQGKEERDVEVALPSSFLAFSCVNGPVHGGWNPNCAAYFPRAHRLLFT